MCKAEYEVLTFSCDYEFSWELAWFEEVSVYECPIGIFDGSTFSYTKLYVELTTLATYIISELLLITHVRPPDQ